MLCHFYKPQDATVSDISRPQSISCCSHVHFKVCFMFIKKKVKLCHVIVSSDLAVAQMAEICRLKDIVHSMDEHLLELV